MTPHGGRCGCGPCLAYAEEMAGREGAFREGRARRPAHWQPRPGTAKALKRIGRGDDKRRQARRSA